MQTVGVNVAMEIAPENLKVVRGGGHIAVCVLTYRRPVWLKRLLEGLDKQKTEGKFTFSITVVDNDKSGSAKAIVTAFGSASNIRVTYLVEPRQSICHARNLAISHSTGDFIAFIDDDEFPEPDWLLGLYTSCNSYDVAGVLGPVLRHFDEPPPKWILKGPFYQRPRHATGFVLPWQEGRTGNVLLRRRIVEDGQPPFDPRYHRGQDVAFFRRMIQAGHVFIWCDDAVVYEVVPPLRWTRSFLLKRALLRGSINTKRDGFQMRSVGKSAVAVPIYVVALPFAFAAGHHHFMSLMVKLCDHLGKLLTLMGLKLFKDDFITD